MRKRQHGKWLFARLPWRTASRFSLSTTWSNFRWLDLLFAGLPGVGVWLRFHCCSVLE